jgi:glycosyltransferase involved in cell wall biosynthesis
MSVRITAVICTRNRCDYLAKAIESLLHQTLPASAYEILVVDNASTDGTRRLVEAWADPDHRLRYVHEPVVGLSQARNTGWRHATGEYVAYLDDDATACVPWLECFLRDFESVDANLGCIGGQIDPVWEAPRPAWLADELVFCVGALDRSAKPILSKDECMMAGGNAAYPRKVLAEIGGFDSSLGRKANNLLSNEEVHVWERIRALGYQGYYDPAALIYHHIGMAKLKKSWVIRRMFWEGISMAVTDVLLQSLTRRQRMGMAAARGKRLALHARRLLRLLVPTDNAWRFARNCETCQELGYVAGMLGRAGAGPANGR